MFCAFLTFLGVTEDASDNYGSEVAELAADKGPDAYCNEGQKELTQEKAQSGGGEESVHDSVERENDCPLSVNVMRDNRVTLTLSKFRSSFFNAARIKWVCFFSLFRLGVVLDGVGEKTPVKTHEGRGDDQRKDAAFEHCEHRGSRFLLALLGLLKEFFYCLILFLFSWILFSWVLFSWILFNEFSAHL